jgi:STE24 endopeptidase
MPEPAVPAENSHAAAGLDVEELAEAKRYGRIELACTLADKALDLLYLIVAAVWLAWPLDRWLGGFAPLAGPDALSRSLRLLALLAAVTLFHVVVSFPLSFYSGYVVEHRFGLSTQRLAGWLWRYAKRNALAVGFSALLVLGLYWLIWTTGRWWWIAAAAGFFLVSVVIGRLTPVLILPLFYKIERLDAPELAERVGRLAEGTGLSIEGVYRVNLSAETVKANAMLAGLGRTRRVLLGDTLLERFSPEEIEVVFAHEIGHHVFRHMHKLIAAGVVYSTLGFWFCDRLLALWFGGAGGALDYAELPVATLPAVMLILMLFGMAVEPALNGLSRIYERQSDRYALRRTDNPEAYASAFRKLARINKDDPSPHWLDVVLFHSHPPIAERLSAADGYRRRRPPAA